MKKKIMLITVILSLFLSILCSALGYWYLNTHQEWTSQVIVEFTNKDANKGYAVDGTKTENIIQELTGTAVLSEASAEIDNLSPDTLSSGLNVEAIIPALETERKDSAMKNGNEYEYFPLQYQVTYTTDERQDVQQILFSVMNAFYQYFTDNHLGETMLPADETSFVNTGYEYLANADLLSSHIGKMIDFLTEQAEKHPHYRSVNTGLSYQDLLCQYQILQTWNIAQLYSTIIANKAAKSPDIIVSKLEEAIAMNANRILDVSKDVEEVAFLLESYSDKHKVYSFYDDDTVIQNTESDSEQDNRIDANHQNILDELHENETKDQPAYDTVIRKFISESDRISFMQQENAYNEYLISVFKDAKDILPETDTDLTMQILDLGARASDLYQLTEQTREEHLECLSAESIRSLSSPTKEEKVSVKLYTIILMIGAFFMSLVGLLWIQAVIRRWKEERARQKISVQQEEQESETATLQIVEDNKPVIKPTTMDAMWFLGKLLMAMRNDRQYDSLSGNYFQNILRAAPLHDIGKIQIPDDILKKPERLTPSEYEIMKHHVDYGEDLIKKTLEDQGDESYSDMAVKMAKYHHERYDGTGYPEGLKGEEIPLEARVMAIADVYDALTSNRVYKHAVPKEQALDIIKKGRGTQFDPHLTDLFIHSVETAD